MCSDALGSTGSPRRSSSSSRSCSACTSRNSILSCAFRSWMAANLSLGGVVVFGRPVVWANERSFGVLGEAAAAGAVAGKGSRGAPGISSAIDGRGGLTRAAAGIPSTNPELLFVRSEGGSMALLAAVPSGCADVGRSLAERIRPNGCRNRLLLELTMVGELLAASHCWCACPCAAGRSGQGGVAPHLDSKQGLKGGRCGPNWPKQNKKYEPTFRSLNFFFISLLG